MRPDGSDVRVLTDNAWEEGAVSWIPSPRQEPERSISLATPFDQVREPGNLRTRR
jgi:hypothetical protein